MSEISNRNNIVNYFYNNLHTAVLSSETTSDKIVLVLDNDKSKIIKTNELITFEMELSGSQIEEYEDYMNRRTERIDNFFKGSAKVMEYNRSTGKFNMVSCSSNDNWLTTKYMNITVGNGYNMEVKRVLVLETLLNSQYLTIPNSEESHFQRGTTNDGIVLDLEVCYNLLNVLHRLDGLGEITKANSNIYVNLIFEQNLRKGG